MPDVGEFAPHFALEGTAGPFSLAEHHGERIVLLFYPGDFTPVCTKQFRSYGERAGDVAALDATIVGISSATVPRHCEFQEMNGIPVPLLADEDREVAKAYGVSQPLFGTRRAVFIIDENGRIAYRKVHKLGLDYHTVDELSRALSSLQAQA